MTGPDILTIRELAALLRVGEKTAYTLAQDGELRSTADGNRTP